MIASRSTNCAISPMSWPTRITAAPSSRCTRASVAMTWRCTTTSSALVGSSAMITLGRKQMAMAIQARCFMPPDSSCGYIRATPSGRPTSASNAAMRRSASPPVRGSPCSARASPICPPMRSTGLSEFIEPCGTSAMPARRSARIPSSSRSPSRVPANHTSPASIRPGGLIKRRIDNAKVDFPEPDSPASPNRSPGARAKLTSSTACTLPSGWSKATRKPRPAGRARSRTSPQAGVGDLVKPDSQKEQAEKDRQDDHGWRGPPPPPAIDHCGVEIDPIKGHPECRRVDRAEPEHFEADRGEDRGGDGAYQGRGQIGQQVWHQLEEDDARPAHTREARHFDIAAFAQRQHLGADRAGGIEPGERSDDNRHLIDGQGSLDRDRDDDQHQQPRHGQTDIGYAANDRVDEAAVKCADEGKHGADADTEEAGNKADA